MTARTTGAAGMLAAVCVAWSALPLPHGRLAGTFLAVAIACALLSVVRLALGRAPDEAPAYLNTAQQSARSVADLIRQCPWAEGMIVAVLALEAQHPSRPWLPWHTGLLGAALLAYLFASNLAESRSRLAVLRPQAPLIAAGLGLLALAAGAAALPAGTGSAADVLALLAAVAAVAVAGLAIPV